MDLSIDLNILETEPAEQYHTQAKDHLSSHQLIDFIKCPWLHFKKHSGLIENKETAAYLIGRATHCRILEGRDAYESEFALGGPINPKTDKPFGKDTQAFRNWAEGQGKPGVHYDDLDQIENMASGLSMNDKAVGLSKLKKPHLKKLERLGKERALFYLMAVSTGLRHKELRSLTLGQLFLDAKPAPYFELYANQSKSGKESRLPLRADVVEKIKQHLEHRSKQGYKTLLFDNPPGIRVFDADCQAAGISKTDARGRVVDIHALRTTFGTHLAVAGVHPRVAQAAMRHSRIELTTNFYTDPALLDVNGAVNALPDFAFKG